MEYDIVQVFGDKYQCRDCGLVKSDESELRDHDCDGHHEEKRQQNEELHFSSS